MPITLPSADPVTLHNPTYSNGRLLVVYNSDVAYSLRLATRYARKKRIPTANLYGIAMGSTDTWDPGNNTALYAVVTALNTALEALGCQGILIAPGVPMRFIVRGYASGSGPPYIAGDPGSVPITQLLSSPSSIIYRYGNVIGGTSPNNLVWTGSPARFACLTRIYTDPLAGASLSVAAGGGPGYRAGVTASSPSATYDLTYTGVNSETITIPSDACMDYLGTTPRVTQTGGYPLGFIGYRYDDNAYYNGGDDGAIPSRYTETETSAQRMVDRACRYSEGLSPANRYRHKIHFQFDGYASGYYQSLGYLHDQLINWGYDSSYFWRQAAASPMDTYVPYSGSAYTLADLDAGRVKDYPYHLMLGDASNTEMLKEPYVSAWKPTGGGACFLGPSEGWQYSMSGLFNQQAASGQTSIYHYGTAIYTSQYCLAHLLLRGMDWLRAYFFGLDANVLGMAFPCGDPLARPFPV